MGERANAPKSDLESRRTGIDRRWIPSENHQPERRGGKDRRSDPKRPFLAPLDDDRPNEDAPASPAANGDVGDPADTSPAFPLVRRWPSARDPSDPDQ